jgi:multidrug resistance efflux pump
MLQPRTKSATESPKPAAATTDGEKQQGGRLLGDRVRSLSLANLPERHFSLSSALGWVLVVGLMGGTSWYWWSSRSAAAKTLAAKSPSEQKSPRSSSSRGESPTKPIESTSTSATPEKAPVRPATFTSTTNSQAAKRDVVLESKGYIIPAHQILVSPKVSGMIVTFNVEEGRRFNKGDVLAVLEQTDYAADLQRVEANVRLMRERLRELQNGNRPEEIKEAEADLQEAQALVPQLEAEYKRTIELRRKNAATPQELELAESKYFAQIRRVQKLTYALQLMQIGPREERIEIAKAELSQAEADVIKAKWRLGNCTILAPVTGTILKKNAEEGNVVNPVAMNGSFSLCDMADLSDLEVELNVQERDISRVQVGQRCRVRAEAYPNRIYEGVVDRLMPIADRAKGAIPVRVKIQIPADEEGVYLKPEMGAIVSFLGDQAESPVAAIAPDPSVMP